MPLLGRLPIRRATLYYVVVFCVVLGGAMLREVNLLFVLAGMILGPLVLSVFWVFTSLRRLGARRRMPRSVCAGDLLVVQVELENKRRRRSSWAVVVEDVIRHAGELVARPRVYFPQVQPGRSGEAAYRGRLVHRGRYEVGPFRVWTRFPFGLVRRAITLGQREELIVLPRIGRLSPGWLARRREAFEGSEQQQPRHSRVEGEFFGVRNWRDGDSRRAVHWRSSARRGGLVVRQFEQPHSRDVAVLVELWQPTRPSRDDLDRVELAVSFAATIVADVCRQGGAELGLGTNDAPGRWTSGPASAALAETAMERLALAEARSDDALAELLATALDEVALGADIILVSTRSVDLDDRVRLGHVWHDPARRAKRRRIRVVESGGADLGAFFHVEAPSGIVAKPTSGSPSPISNPRSQIPNP